MNTRALTARMLGTFKRVERTKSRNPAIRPSGARSRRPGWALLGLIFTIGFVLRKLPGWLCLGLALAGLLLAAGCLAGPRPARLVVAPPHGRPVEPNVNGRTASLAEIVTISTAAVPLPVSIVQPAATQVAPTVVSPALPAVPGVADILPPAPPNAAVPGRRVPILEYHYSSFEMLPTVMMRPAWFQAQMQWLAAAGFHSLSSADLAGFVTGGQPVPARSVALTFDVGASHFDEYADVIVPALRRNHLQAIFFVIPNQTKDSCDGQLACWPDLLAWRDEGLISIESHSYMHEDYATLSPERLAFDIRRSKAAIEAKTGRPVLGLCYPFDSVTPAAVGLLAKAGYRYAVAGATRHDRSAQWNDPQPFVLPRYYPYSGETTYPVIGGSGGLTFAQLMLGASADS